MSWILMVFGIAILFVFGANPAVRWSARALLSCLVFLFVIYHGLDGISGDGLNEAVIYHVVTGLEGVGLAGQQWYVIRWLAVLLAGLCVMWWATGRAPRKYNFSVLQAITLLMLAGAIYTAPLTAQIRSQSTLIGMLLFPGDSPPGGASSLGQLQSLYVTPGADSVQKLDKNIVWIYLEGLEKTYFDRANFDDLFPHMRALSESAIRFEGVRQGFHTWWTMGGMVGSQCGVPLLPFGDS